ncbi:MAG: sigma-70 family RNA polymerase sigma factor [Actinobacteria bacterium]|nr:sigma-70 family RNA polymerase sigma factor [Actinomycetota bacterium]
MEMFRRDERIDLARSRFERLVREHHRPLHAYVRVLYPSAHADAVVNATFAQLWQHLVDVPDGAVRTWLRASARHEVLNSSRRERRWYATTDRAARLSTDHVPGPDVDMSAELAEVMAALATLDPSDRELVLMTALEELNSAEVAEILGIRPVAARRRLSRARARLRAALERNGVVVDQEEAS